MERPSVLLTTVCRPFGGAGEGDSVGAELFHAQVTRAQGVFSLRQVIRGWGLDYIAGNLSCPSVVLHYPSEREFVRELQRRRYDYVGITFVVATFYKVKRMAALVRRHAPGAKIILGGYGTVLPDELLAPLADHICREEGIAFFRRLIGEDPARPLRHPYAPIPSPTFFSYRRPTKVAHITGGLGCPNGCDFCCTSHFFHRRYIPFAKTGRDLYEAILGMEREARRAGDELGGFILIDEDFFLQEQRAREYLECVRQAGRAPSIMGFGSVRGLSQFTAEEIAEMGFETIWVAFESPSAGYGKMKGREIGELFRALESHGIAILASMIIGFPHQDRDAILRDFEHLMSLEPAFTQILIYFAFPGTPFYRRAVAEGRYLPQYSDSPDYRRWDGFSMHFKHPHLTAPEVEALQRELYRRDFERLGPSLVRVPRAWFNGYMNLRDSPNPLLRARAERMREFCRGAVAGLVPAFLLGPSEEARRRARELLREIERETGALTLVERLKGVAAILLAGWTWLTLRTKLFQQPKLLRLEYRPERNAEGFGAVQAEDCIPVQPPLAVREEES
ncbi:MAG: radical SAM protein [Bryobacteraceae bacterium]